MKNLTTKKLILAIMLLFGITLYSCTDDTVMPDPGTTNIEQFLGTWSVYESCIRLNYEVEIVADTSVDSKYFIYNFAFMGQEFDPAYGFVSGTKVTLPSQTIGDNWQLNGSGTLQSDGKIIWTYYLQIGANGSNCQANYEK
jgi:hypothetical protein